MKPGYKQTEVGVIPRDWGVAALGDLNPFVTSGSRGWANHYSYYGDLFVRITNLTRESIYLDLANCKYVKIPEGDSEGTRTQLREKDLLISITADIGIVGYVDSSVPSPAYINQHIALVRFDESKVSGKFVSYFLTSERSKKNFYASTDTGAKAGMSLGGVQKILMALPSLSEQSAIADALGDVDALLSSLDTLIAKKRDLKQAAMQQLLTGKIRLPGFGGEWETKRLGELANIRSGGTPSTNVTKFWDGTIPWCTPTDITQLNGNKYLAGTSRTISQEGLGNSSAEMIPANSVVMTSRATIGECAINVVPVTTNQGFKNLVPFASTDVEFLYYLLQTQKQGFIRLCAGSTFLEIGKTQLVAYEVRLPATKEEQTAIAGVLGDMDAELAALEIRREKTRLLKQGMMQELLTGKTRLAALAAASPTNSAQVIDFPSKSGKPNGEPVEPESKASGKKANVHFIRSVLAAEIIDRLHDEPTFGHVKCEKVIYLADRLCKVDTGSHYHRDAAGPYDNRALRSIDSQLKRQQWFDAQKVDGRYRYVPMAKRGEHKPYFDRYFDKAQSVFDRIIDTFRSMTTEQCEIVATLFEAWRDLLERQLPVSDDAIVHEVLNNWHESKQRISEDRWRRALDWMREKGFIPDGAEPAC